MIFISHRFPRITAQIITDTLCLSVLYSIRANLWENKKIKESISNL